MAFDSGMLSAVVWEVNKLASQSRVDKINQPEKAEIVFTLRAEKETLKLCISASSGSPRIAFEKNPKDNPKVAPSLCMSLRKHLGGSRLMSCELMGFERVALFRFAARDELGYISEKRLYAEIMGKYSGFILCDGEDRIITASRFVDFSANAVRKIIPGITYELPPKQDKYNPLEETAAGFAEKFLSSPDEIKAECFIRNTYMGISPLVSREITFLSAKSADALIKDCDCGKLWFNFSNVINIIKTCNFTPTLVEGTDFTFMPITQYGNDAKTVCKESISELIEDFFLSKSKDETAKHYAKDLYTVTGNVRSKIARKMQLFCKEIEDCKKKDKYKLYGDLITSNIYLIKKGDKSVAVQNYFDEDCPIVEIPLDTRLTPSQNAQSYYKKYAKLKTGERYKKEQLEKAQAELDYIESVIETLDRAGNDDDYGHIREELTAGGYMKKSSVTPGRKLASNAPIRYLLPSGRAVYIGKNNAQNDYIDTKIAEKNDYWFHVKNYAGSHVILVTDGTEPSDEDYTNAAILAAYNSKARGGENVAVDYTLVKNLKKPAGAVPGFVTYQTNYTAYVDAVNCPEIKKA